jgi:hypothetical protein
MEHPLLHAGPHRPTTTDGTTTIDNNLAANNNNNLPNADVLHANQNK